MKGIKLARALVSRKALTTLVFFVTSRCNARCGFCFYRTNKKSADELTLEEIRSVSEKAGPVYEVLLSGGEPFLRDDIVDIAAAFIRNNRPVHLNIPTNGSFPVQTIAAARRLSSLMTEGELSIMVSLDDIGARHDALRGVTGLFDRAVGLLKELREISGSVRNFRVGVVTTLNSSNADRIEEIIDFVRTDLGVPYLCVNYPRGTPASGAQGDVGLDVYRKAVEYLFAGRYEQFKANRGEDALARAIDRVRYETVLATLAEKRCVYPCRAAVNTVVISETGDVFPCELLDWRMGNLRESGYSLPSILKASGGACHRKISREKCRCSWECMTHWNILYNPAAYPRIIRHLLMPGRHA